MKLYIDTQCKPIECGYHFSSFSISPLHFFTRIFQFFANFCLMNLFLIIPTQSLICCQSSFVLVLYCINGFRGLQAIGQDVSGEELHEILNEIDLNLNGQVEMDEYLQVMFQYLKSRILTMNEPFSFFWDVTL